MNSCNMCDTNPQKENVKWYRKCPHSNLANLNHAIENIVKKSLGIITSILT